jgi:hypothetical protein
VIDSTVRRLLWAALALLLIAVSCTKPATKPATPPPADSEIIFKGGLTCVEHVEFIECTDGTGKTRMRMYSDHDEIYYSEGTENDIIEYRNMRVRGEQ